MRNCTGRSFPPLHNLVISIHVIYSQNSSDHTKRAKYVELCHIRIETWGIGVRTSIKHLQTAPQTGPHYKFFETATTSQNAGASQTAPQTEPQFFFKSQLNRISAAHRNGKGPILSFFGPLPVAMKTAPQKPHPQALFSNRNRTVNRWRFSKLHR